MKHLRAVFKAFRFFGFLLALKHITFKTELLRVTPQFRSPIDKPRHEDVFNLALALCFLLGLFLIFCSCLFSTFISGKGSNGANFVGQDLTLISLPQTLDGIYRELLK